MRGVDVTVISFVRQAGGRAAGSVSGSATHAPSRSTALVAAADAAARAADPAEDAERARPVTRRPPTGTSRRPRPTSTSSTAFAPALGEAFGRAAPSGRMLYGFVDHEVTTTYLGSSTGLRLRHVQPTGHYGCTGKTADLTNSAWVGGATRDFAGVDAARARVPSSSDGSAGGRAASTCRPAATTRSCRRPRWPT